MLILYSKRTGTNGASWNVKEKTGSKADCRLPQSMDKTGTHDINGQYENYITI